MTLECRPIGEGEAGRLKELLEAEELITVDIGAPHVEFCAFYDMSGWLRGVGGLEIYGPQALLRSLVTVPDARGQGVGAEMVLELEKAAMARGCSAVYLLTTTAAAFFEKQGFGEIGRDDVPDAIRATGQFAVHCPPDATVMWRSLTA